MDSDTEDRDEETPEWKGVSGTIVLLNMYDPMNTGTPKKALEATCDLLRGYMREANSQLISVCLYGVSKSCAAGVEGLKQLLPLAATDLDNFLNIQVVDTNVCVQAKQLKLSDALWHANKLFANCKKLLSSKNLLLLTRADIAPVDEDQKPTLKRVRDLVDSGVEIKIINIANCKYHVDKFYKTLLAEANKTNQDIPVPDPLWEVSDIVKQMLKHSHRHLAVARLSLDIGEGLSIGVGLYKLLKSNIKPKKVIADKDTNKILSRQTTYWKKNVDQEDDVENAEPGGGCDVPLLKSELFVYKVIGGERILFNKEEANYMRCPFGPPTLKLLGFKPANVLNKGKWFVSPCYLLYPNESIIEGSTVAFNAMHQACTEMSALAICVLITRKNANTKIVALSPCKQPLGLDEIKVAFDVIPLPFAENVRQLEIDEEDVTYTEPQKVFVKSIIEELKFDYKADMFENPHVGLLTQAIEALAFEEETVSPYKDTTVPADEKYQNIDAELFHEIFPTQQEKRKPVRTAKEVPPKKQKIDDAFDEELLKTRLQYKEVHLYTMNQLKQILDTKGVPYRTSTKKPALCTIVYENCQ